MKLEIDNNVTKLNLSKWSSGANLEARHLRIQTKLAKYLMSLNPDRRYGKHHPRDLALVCNETVPNTVRTMRHLGWNPTGGLLTACWYPPSFPRHNN